MSSKSRSEGDRASGTPPPITVRRAIKADVPAIASLARELNRHQREPTRYLTKAALLRDGFGRRPQFGTLVAEIDGRTIGYVIYVDSYETGWAERGLFLQDIYVREDARRGGVARALVAAAAHEARRRGGDYVWCAAKIWNRGAQAAYRAMGAVEEPVMAYSWIRGTFARLARDGTVRQTRSRRGKRGS